jgi:NAD(P)H-hydrate epimerase
MRDMGINVPPQLAGAFRMRPLDANKYSVGTVAVVGGSSRYANAPVMAGLGARAAGAGLVHLVVPPDSRISAGSLLPEATFTRLTPNCVPPKADSTVIGMGLGSGVGSELTVSRLISDSSGRFVLDADALKILAGWYGRSAGYDHPAGQELVLTPHEGEAAKLLGVESAAVASDRMGAARAIVDRYGATVVLKGAKTLVVSADGSRTYENATGNPFMALGGMGDLLAGAIAARWAYLKCDPFTAAASAVWLHGLASDRVVADRRDPSISNTAAEIGALRVILDCGTPTNGETP